MEDILQNVSNDHRSIYYGVQLKIMDVSQSIKLMGTAFKENQLKTDVAEMINHFYMLEAILQQSKIPHIYQLIKTIVINFNSVSAILFERLEKAAQKEISLMEMINRRQEQQNANSKNDECIMAHGNLMKEIKKNHLGGIHLFNQNYSRYLEDQKILDQIKVEKERRLQRKRIDILRQSVLQQLSHQTDVQKFIAKSDDIARYIVQAKDKNSIFNYVSYEPELQQILGFFQNSQNQANQFLMKKMRNISDEEGSFSFADFQRDIQHRNSQFRKQAVEKMNNFIEKYRAKQKEMEQNLKEKDNILKQIQRKHRQRCDKEIETDINFSEYLQMHDKQIRDLQQKCYLLENMSKQNLHNDERQNGLKHQLAEKETEIDKLTRKVIDLQASIESVKQLLRDQRIKKVSSTKQIEKSQKIIPQYIPHAEKERKLYVPIKQKIPEKYILTQDNVSDQSNDFLRKTASVNNNWRKKELTDSATFLSFHDVQKNKDGHQSLKPERKIVVNYQHNKSMKNLEQSSQSQSNSSEIKTSQIGEKVDSQPSALQLNKQTTQQQSKKSQSNRKKETIKPEKNVISSKIDSKSKSKNNSNKQSNTNTPKQSSKAIDGQPKKSIKNISENISKLNSNATSLKRIRFEQTQNQRIILSEHSSGSEDKQKVNVEKCEKSVQIDLNAENAQMKKDCDDSIKSCAEEQALSNKIESTHRFDKKKAQGTYEMYEVTEEEAQEQTIKQSLVTSKHSSMKSFPNKENQFMEKLNTEIRKSSLQKCFRFQNLYNLVIYPQTKPQNSGRSKMEHIQTQESDKPPYGDQSHRKVAKLFDSLMKNEGSTNQFKADKLKKWRKVILNNLKSDVISDDQVDQIMSVIRGSSFTKNSSSLYENAVSSIASISSNFRNSLPQIQQVNNTSSKTKLPNLKKIKAKQVSEDNAQNHNKQSEKCILLTEFEQEIEELIKHQSLQNNFTEKFHSLHRHCEEGPLCAHVTKYFDTIMRHYEQSKKKERQSIALPIEKIGNRSKVEDEALHRNFKKLQHNKSLIIGKQNNLNRKNYSFTKNRYSQEIILPSIKDHRLPNINYNSSKYVI